MSMFVDDSAEAVLPTYGEASDPVGFKRRPWFTPKLDSVGDLGSRRGT
jgi:hypothetical protein